MWLLKVKALTQKNWIDDTEMEEEALTEILLDENALASAPRPGTSLKKPLTGTINGRRTVNQSMRPSTKDGRPITGFARPGTVSRSTGNLNVIENAFQDNRPGTSRAVTSSGRFIRLGTASIRSEEGSAFIKVDQLDLKKYASRPALGRALCDYLIYCEHNPTKAMELAAFATVEEDFKNWWWKARLGKCYYQLGLYRDAEKQFKSSLNIADMIATYLELSKVYIKLDQPNTALENYSKGCESHPSDTHLIIGQARIYDQLGDIDRCITYYEKVLDLDSANIESIACIASNYFYEDQPEIALRLYRRLVQMGVNNTEIWNNLALCCFYSSQYDTTLSCFERALSLADDSNMADVWYNIAQVAVGVGDLNLAYQSLKVAVSIDNTHAESFNNLGVLELRQENIEEAKSCFDTAIKLGPFLYEPLFNSALLSYKMGNYQEAFVLVNRVLKDIYPEHTDSQELQRKLKQNFF